MSDFNEVQYHSWESKKVLVTAGEGFIASHLAKLLVERGANVVVTVRPRTRAVSMLDLFGLKSHLHIFQCDLRDSSLMTEIIATEHVEYVFHLGAQAIVGAASRSPLSTIQTNVMGTANVLEACRGRGIVVVAQSSDKAYGLSSILPYKEWFPLNGRHLYDATKAMADILAQSYCHEYGSPVIVTRPCNVYGPDLNFSRLVPATTARVVLENLPPVIVSGQDSTRREYIHVSDLVEALLVLAQADISPESNHNADLSFNAFNIGSGFVATPREIIHLIQKQASTNFPATELKRGGNELGDQSVDCSKIRRLGWQPLVDFEQGLADTIAWYQEHREFVRPLYLSEISMGHNLLAA